MFAVKWADRMQRMMMLLLTALSTGFQRWIAVTTPFVLTPNPDNRQRAAGMVCMLSGVLLLGVASAPRLEASREVLSDLDCVIEPGAIVELGAAVPGLLDRVDYDRSDFVSAGTVMAELESDMEQANLAITEMQASTETALELRQVAANFGERTRVRNAALLKTEVISEQNMDQVITETRIAQLQVRQESENQRLAELEVKLARAALHRRQITSPIDGVVMKRYKSQGEYLDSEAVYQIAQLDPLNVEVIVPVEYMGQISAGMRTGVSIAAPGYENRVVEAIVQRVDAVADAASATYGVRLSVDNADMTIPSGVRCEVDFFASS